MLVTDLFDRYNGSTIAVCAGGPAMMDELDQLDVDVTIGVNHHCEGLFMPDFVVAYDDRPDTMKWVTTNTVGPFDWQDYHTQAGGRPLLTVAKHNSAFKATELAVRMGAEEVYLTGVDCYAGEKPYANSDVTYEELWNKQRYADFIRRREYHVSYKANAWAACFSMFPQVKPIHPVLKRAWR